MPIDQLNKNKTYSKDGFEYRKGILDLIGKKGIEDMYDKKSGFFDLPVKSIYLCNHKEHNPPSHLYIPPGKGYRHICPACNNVIEIIPPQITL